MRRVTIRHSDNNVADFPEANYVLDQCYAVTTQEQ